MTRLLAKAAAGDARAFTRLYRTLHPLVYAYFARRTDRSADAEDLTARVFERVVMRLSAYEADKGTVKTWVLTMARNILIDELRRRRPEAGADEREELLADASLVPSRGVDQDEAATIVRDLLAQVPAQTREIFALRYADGMRHGEIADLLGLSEAAVKQRVSRVMRLLRERGQALQTDKGVGYAL
jgi:RNA polymerase sigma-70 factor (ECF subfamily)